MGNVALNKQSGFGSVYTGGGGAGAGDPDFWSLAEVETFFLSCHINLTLSACQRWKALQRSSQSPDIK